MNITDTEIEELKEIAQKYGTEINEGYITGKTIGLTVFDGTTSFRLDADLIREIEAYYRGKFIQAIYIPYVEIDGRSNECTVEGAASVQIFFEEA